MTETCQSIGADRLGGNGAQPRKYAFLNISEPASMAGLACQIPRAWACCHQQAIPYLSLSSRILWISMGHHFLVSINLSVICTQWKLTQCLWSQRRLPSCPRWMIVARCIPWTHLQFSALLLGLKVGWCPARWVYPVASAYDTRCLPPRGRTGWCWEHTLTCYINFLSCNSGIDKSEQDILDEESQWNLISNKHKLDAKSKMEKEHYLALFDS